MNIDIIELRDGTSVKWMPLLKAEYDNLLKPIASKPPIKGYFEKYGIEVRFLDDQKVIARDKDYYGLYFSLDDFDKVLADFKGGVHSTELLLNKNKFGEKFSVSTSILINELLDTLIIKDTKIDEQLLKVVDSKIDMLPDPEGFRKEHLIHFIALVGEALIRKHSCTEWEMVLASDGITWNPYLNIRNHRVPFFTYLYEDIFIRTNRDAFLLLEVYETVNDIERQNIH